MSSGLRCRIAGNEKNLRRLIVRSGGVFFVFRGGGVSARKWTGVDLVDLVDWAKSADEQELVPTGGLYFLLRTGARDLMSRGVPR